MTSIQPKKTPKGRADWRLSNLVLEGGKSKRPDGKYISRDEKHGVVRLPGDGDGAGAQWVMTGRGR